MLVLISMMNGECGLHEFPFNFFCGCFSLNKYVIEILSLAKLCTARDRIFRPTEHKYNRIKDQF